MQRLFGSAKRKRIWQMKKLLIVVAGLLLVVGGIAAVKVLQIADLIGFVTVMEEEGMPPVPVATVAVIEEEWEQTLEFPGTLRAVEGVHLTAEVGGVVTNIAVENGAEVNQGDLLFEMDVTTEQAELAASEARLRLAKVNLERAKGLLERRTISQSEYDTAAANLDEATAIVENLRSVIRKKVIRAPFSGRVGIREVNVGQTVAQGDPIIPIFNDNPIFVEFSVPQSQLPFIKTGQTVRVRVGGNGKHETQGTITAINPALNEITRSVRVQGTLDNPDGVLRPGEFVQAVVVQPEKKRALAVPVTAIVNAAYGDSVFIVEEKDGQQIARQQFVQTGGTRGDFVAVEEGISAGERVVSSGAFKLGNGMRVLPNDSMQPTASANPVPVSP